jgi:hypothetical protein
MSAKKVNLSMSALNPPPWLDSFKCVYSARSGPTTTLADALIPHQPAPVPPLLAKQFGIIQNIWQSAGSPHPALHCPRATPPSPAFGIPGICLNGGLVHELTRGRQIAYTGAQCE